MECSDPSGSTMKDQDPAFRFVFLFFFCETRRKKQVLTVKIDNKKKLNKGKNQKKKNSQFESTLKLVSAQSPDFTCCCKLQSNGMKRSQ